MRIAIDYTSAIAQQAGIGRYTRSLVAALAQVDSADEFLLLSAEAPTSARAFPVASNMRPRVIGLGGTAIGNRRMTILWQRARVPLPVELFTGRCDVFHAPDFSLPPLLSTPSVVTIHDLAFHLHPECALPSLVTYLNGVVPRAVRRADAVIAISERTATDLVEWLRVPREKIHVIHLGVTAGLRPVTDAGELRRVAEQYGLRHPLVLAVGTIEPRKNYARLIEAFARASKATGGPAMLAIAGRNGWLYEDVLSAPERFGVADSVRFLHYVPEADLATLYSLADVVAVPSIYEGFGIPVLEAMACDTPVVCADAGSLPEVAGDAAEFVAPLDVETMAAALVRVVREPALRAALIARGRDRVRAFTWETTARRHLDVYRVLADGRTHATGTSGGRPHVVATSGEDAR